MANLLVGKLSVFNHELQEWEIYKDRLEQWLIANELTDMEDGAQLKRRAILLSSLSDSTYKLVRDLALPENIGKLSYDAVTKLLDDHFKTIKCGFAERYSFHSSTQHQNESLIEWAGRVRSLANYCDFPVTTLNEALRDRFVLGMLPGRVKDKLFSMKLSEVSLSKAISVAEALRAREASAPATALPAPAASAAATLRNPSSAFRCRGHDVSTAKKSDNHNFIEGSSKGDEVSEENGLPPVLNPAQKIEKLRKLDALQNRDYEEEYRSRRRRPSPEQGYDQGYTLGGSQDMDEATRQEFKNLKPMSPTQFMKRFSSLQVSPPPTAKSGDRFPEIKSSLRELRRGLNEVTAPYNANNNAVYNNERARPPSPVLPNELVQLPCEFCNMLVPADDLVQHQTGCRPDLAQLGPELREAQLGPELRESASPRTPSPSEPGPARIPCIPCEFCMRSLPVYLIIEHQEQCIRENMPV